MKRGLYFAPNGGVTVGEEPRRRQGTRRMLLVPDGAEYDGRARIGLFVESVIFRMIERKTVRRRAMQKF
jgi:hypothetical protein